jgi:hypothetical protein
MPEDLPPSLFELLRSDIRDMRSDFNARLDKLVSTDAFAAEQKRRDELHSSLVQDLADERVARERAIAQEASFRDAQVAAERDARIKAHEATDARSRRAWAGVRWTVLAVLIAAGVLTGYLALFWRN